MSASNQRIWTDLYRDALLEVDLAKLPMRIEEAMQAIQNKLREIQQDGNNQAERQALEDALQNLRVLQREVS